MLGRPDGLSTPVVLDLNRADEIASHDVDLFDACVDSKTPSSHGLPPSPPHGPGPIGIGSFTTPYVTYRNGGNSNTVLHQY